MSRGLGRVETYVVTYLSVDRKGRPALLIRMGEDWSHMRRALAGSRGQCTEICDCAGAVCRRARRSDTEVVRQAVVSLERKGIVRRRYDAIGRLVVEMTEVPHRWRYGGREPINGPARSAA